MMAKTELFNQKATNGLVSIVGSRFTTGNVFFVDSGSATASDSANLPAGQSPDTPFATIDFAIGQCTANNGDHIFVMPGHAETITAAAGIAVDVNGVSIVGLGGANDRPTISYSTAATADFDVSANNAWIENLVFDLTGIDGLDTPIDVDGDDVTFKDCRIEFADAGGQADLAMAISGDRTTIDHCHFHGSGDAGTTTVIQLTGTDETIIRNCRIHGAFTTTLGGISVDTTACTNLDINGNYIENNTASATVCIDLIAGCTGVLRYNYLRVTNDAQVGLIDTPANTSLIENYLVNNDGEAGILAGTPSV